MKDTHGSAAERQQPDLYEIRLKGHLDARWTDWFEGLTLIHASDGTTILTVQVIDQPSLHGLLRKVRDVGLPLVSVLQVDPDQAEGTNHSEKRGGHT